MERYIDSRFDRVEKALATLINSISTYNPSPALANDLVAADQELSQGLEKLATHQHNYAKIQSLRATSNALDNQIRETLTLLTETRAALISTPSTTFPESTYPVSYAELLSYARMISKFTLPSTYRDVEARATTDGSGPATAATGNTPREVKTESHINGTGTPILATNGTERPSSAMDIDSGTQSKPQASQATTTSLPNEISQWLNPTANLPFIPWPNEESIRRGALAVLQDLQDRGIDPATYDPAKIAEQEEERRLAAEEEERQKEEKARAVEEARRLEMERRAADRATSFEGRREEKPKVFQLETFDEDDD
ncbi:vitamin-D-receptor interacting mediator subunit 4-domain-containing protein [Xylogone sp. PMI_703]|nr:vitamin-D-receptor interacting mediator subunit 4-domain-containing protein [Xylogone sp. PMI_703]